MIDMPNKLSIVAIFGCDFLNDKNSMLNHAAKESIIANPIKVSC